MKRYYERLAPENQPLLSRSLLGEAFRDIDAAARLAKDRPDVQARLAHLKHYLRYIHLRWLVDNETDKARRKELTVAALTLVYRTRYEYMNHWAAIRSEWIPKAAKEFEEPSWATGDKVSKPWQVDEAVTRQETEQWFQDGLAYFQAQLVKEQAFSSELVAAHFPGTRTAPSQHQFQRGARYALCSREGEPLELEITPGTIAWYRDRPDARYTLTDLKGRKIAEGRLKLDGEQHKLTLKVPKAGTWFFEFNDSDAGWRIKAAAERGLTLLPNRGHGYMHQGHMSETFFYVPKGTRQIQYFWNGSSHKMFSPDGKLAHTETRKGEIVTVDVPEGMDGKCWSFRELALGHLWFFNVPNCLAASPGALLLPKDVVQKDKL